ncbi:hypothetical protein ABR737_41245 [Streptomyces sp. Edi2]
MRAHAPVCHALGRLLWREDEGFAKFTAVGNELFEQLEAELHTKRTAA